MGTRRKARECSLHMLYAVDNCNVPIESIYNSFAVYFPKGEAYRMFALDLFKGVCDNKEDLDSLIKQCAKNWEIERMAAVDRNIIRLATYEIMATTNIPIRVIIDEAVEISKKYSTKDSSKFVNGILDKLKKIRTQKNQKNLE
ncbi:N utilization substance protein B [Endomicrobiia bacterium]|uniref:Transcription antitermination protein NusB n=1 Tax=Endomicrobium trichonymphae TaxID=1408204 RepID=B1H071_ENDTX|nr:transcription antitermination factor NusB [Candidatus Endomicrobium trichonymphae]GHT03925.1 N utilization substance protein B [Endomicrobiia bacterium]BAG13903.1 transcription antitermination factor NusB [Candidatus Endomicrobium trichonymphae]BAV59019.1 transcription antitermination factor NusB [Candidatus Endomicrobium trichonymphae]GHT09119.1 N utilization substance protein B [Endomicrobiia bacterium]GHT11126.1 N utilization substance protein B [Endomicrobiia bacterium]